MRKVIVALILAATGIVLAAWGISALAYCRSFTETTEGVVERRADNEIVLGFHEERSSSQIHFSGDEEHAFPVTPRTDKLKVGDRIAVYHPAGRLHDARFDKDISCLLPCIAAASGGILLLISAAMLFLPMRRSP